VRNHRNRSGNSPRRARFIPSKTRAAGDPGCNSTLLRGSADSRFATAAPAELAPKQWNRRFPGTVVIGRTQRGWSGRRGCVLAEAEWAKEAEFEAGEEQRGAVQAAVPRSEAQSTIRGQVHASPSDTQGRSRVPELGSLGSVRGVLSNEHSYRECVRLSGKEQGGVILKII
jgi:hypothetical protein